MYKTLLVSLLLVSFELSSFGAEQKVDVCDISFLWPVPQTKLDAEKLISVSERQTQGGDSILPQQVFDQILKHADQVQLDDSGETIKIEFHDNRLKNIENWKIAAIRIDPSAPGCSSKIRIDQKFGSTAQIRLTLQPVIVDDNDAKAHDFTMHVVYSYVKNQERPFEADNIRFAEVIKNLLSIKKALASASIETTGAKLGVHPGFSSTTVDLTQLLREFLKKHLTEDRLTAVAFMGIKSGAEPWVFFATSRERETGKFMLVNAHPSLGGSSAQMLSFVTTNAVFPKPKNHQFGLSLGVATNELFSVVNLDKLLFPNATEMPLKDIKVRHAPDIVSNPNLSHFFTTDCVSCHTESSLRHSKLGGISTEFSYKLPDGVSGVEPGMLPTHLWNVRNFGWGFKAFRMNMVPTVTMRTANEAAESAEFINDVYLSSPE